MPKFSPIYLLAGLICLVPTIHHSSAQTPPAGSSGSKKCADLPNPKPINLPFSPATDGKTVRPATRQQSNKPCDDTLAVKGVDQRLPVNTSRFPWSAIGRLDIARPDGREFHQCTGTLIDRDLVLTNAHCVFTEDGQPIIAQGRQMIFKPNFFKADPNNSEDKGSLDVANATLVAYGTKQPDPRDPNAEPDKDWALLKLDQPLGDQYGYLGWRTLDFSKPQNTRVLAQQLRLAGYSGDYPKGNSGNIAGVHVACSMEGLSQTLKIRDREGKPLPKDMIIHDCDTIGGSSGSSIIALFNDGQYYIVGIHAGWYPIDPKSYPQGSRDTCKVHDPTEQDPDHLSDVGYCVNRGVQVSRWAAQANALRKQGAASAGK